MSVSNTLHFVPVAPIIMPPDSPRQLLDAIEAGNCATVNDLIHRGSSIDASDASHLRAAAFKGCPSIMAILLDALHGAGRGDIIDTPNQNGMTPLYIAAQKDHSEIVTALTTGST